MFWGFWKSPVRGMNKLSIYKQNIHFLNVNYKMYFVIVMGRLGRSSFGRNRRYSWSFTNWGSVGSIFCQTKSDRIGLLRVNQSFKNKALSNLLSTDQGNNGYSRTCSHNNCSTNYSLNNCSISYWWKYRCDLWWPFDYWFGWPGHWNLWDC